MMTCSVIIKHAAADQCDPRFMSGMPELPAASMMRSKRSTQNVLAVDAHQRRPAKRGEQRAQHHSFRLLQLCCEGHKNIVGGNRNVILNFRMSLSFSTQSNKLVGTKINSSTTRSQLSSLRAAGITVRVLAPGQMGGYKPNQPAQSDRVTIMCDVDGTITKVTVG
jgi:hypothetical protein